MLSRTNTNLKRNLKSLIKQYVRQMFARIDCINIQYMIIN